MISKKMSVRFHGFIINVNKRYPLLLFFANRVDPDEMAQNEPFHLDLHWWPICFLFCVDMPVCYHGPAHIRTWENLFQLKRLMKLLRVPCLNMCLAGTKTRKYSTNTRGYVLKHFI